MARVAQLAKMALFRPRRPHHTHSRHQPRQRRQRFGGRAAATQPSTSEKEKCICFNHGSSFVFRSFKRGEERGPEDLQLPFQFLRMYSSIADPTVRTCIFERL